MKRPLRALCLAILALGGAALTGCLNLKPAADPTRYFVLTPLPPGTEALTPPAPTLAVGIGRVGISPYLDGTRLAVRKGPNEILYNDYLRWSEGLDQGIQRLLALNLARLLGTDQIYLSDWRRDQVAGEVYLEVGRFDFDPEGRTILEAFWSIRRPGTGQRLYADSTRLERSGPPPASDPGGAVAVLSELVAELSREMAGVLQALP